MIINHNLYEVTNHASNSTRKRHLKLWLITHILVRKKYRRYGYLVNAYMRWADDIIDNPRIDITAKELFLQRQYLLIEDFIKDDNSELNYFEENYLFHVVQFAKETKRIDYITYIRINLNAFALDINRLKNEGNFSVHELEQYLDLLLTPVFFFTRCFVAPNSIVRNSKYFVGKFFYYVLSLRDFVEDLNAGYINVCKEDVNKYSINLKDIHNDPNLFTWVKELYPKIVQILDEELQILREMPLLIKFIWFPGFIDQYGDLVRIRLYAYEIIHERKTKWYLEIHAVCLMIIKTFEMTKKIFL
jgi:hypothetical protein